MIILAVCLFNKKKKFCINNKNLTELELYFCRMHLNGLCFLHTHLTYLNSKHISFICKKNKLHLRLQNASLKLDIQHIRKIIVAHSKRNIKINLLIRIANNSRNHREV